MLTEQYLAAIEARAEITGRESVSYTGRDPSSYVKWPGCAVCHQDLPALLADREELVALAKDLIGVLIDCTNPNTSDCGYETGLDCSLCKPEHDCLTWRLLSKARSAGLVEAK